MYALDGMSEPSKFIFTRPTADPKAGKGVWRTSLTLILILILCHFKQPMSIIGGTFLIGSGLYLEQAKPTKTERGIEIY